jgi:hypothetical protein
MAGGAVVTNLPGRGARNLAERGANRASSPLIGYSKRLQIESLECDKSLKLQSQTDPPDRVLLGQPFFENAVMRVEIRRGSEVCRGRGGLRVLDATRRAGGASVFHHTPWRSVCSV